MNRSPFRQKETHRVSYARPAAPKFCDCGHDLALRRTDGSCAYVHCACVSHKPTKTAAAQEVAHGRTDGGGTARGSMFEGDEANFWNGELAAGRVAQVDRHVQLELVVNGYLLETYVIDFRITHLDGTITFIETKGMHTPQWKWKWKLFWALYSVKSGVKIICRQQRHVPRARMKKTIG